MIASFRNNLHLFILFWIMTWISSCYFCKGLSLLTKSNRSSRIATRLMYHRLKNSNYKTILPALIGSTTSIRTTKTRLFSSISNNNANDIIAVNNNDNNNRLPIIHEQLERLGIDANALHNATIQSIQEPSTGYDNNFGKSAIKTYRSFLNPKKEEEGTLLQLEASAVRCARHVDFLLKRHKSREAEWIRHTDDEQQKRTVYPLILVLDNVRSAFNVGSLFRTADATGCSLVITTGITPHPGGSGAEKVGRSGLGAERIVPHGHFSTTMEAIEYLRTEYSEYEIFGMETTDKSIDYTTISYKRDGGGCVFVLGNEVSGVDTEIMPYLDRLIEIPMFGAKNSLNIAACAPVVLYEVLRQWNTATDEEGN